MGVNSSTKVRVIVAGIILVSILTAPDIVAVLGNPQPFLKFGPAASTDRLIQVASAKPATEVTVKSGNITTVDLKAESGSARGTIPLQPSIVHIHKGDTVMWINNDNVNHNIVSLIFNSSIIWPKVSGHGPSTFSHTFNNVGTVAYVDILHPYLGGVIYVDVPTTQRELISTTASFVNVKRDATECCIQE